jgi:nucleoside-diphosphate-sugar epimerase
MTANILMTGASGFLGRRLTHALTQQSGNRLYLLVRSEKAEKRIVSQLGAREASKVQFVYGDVTQSLLGQSTARLLDLSRKIDEVWHLAASTSFDDARRAEIEAINLDGTRNVISVLKGFGKLRMLYQMSTAYCCGRMRGAMPEDYFPRPPTFRNAYEESKYEAEQLVRVSGLPAIVIRPSIIMGDSRDGDYFGERRMVYGYATALYVAVAMRCGGAEAFRRYWRGAIKGGPRIDLDSRLMGAEHTPLNLVTVDDVVKVCLAIRAGQVLHSRAYNVVNAAAMPVGKIMEAFQHLLCVCGLRYDVSLVGEGPAKDNVVERAAYRHTRPFWSYLLQPVPRWVTTNTRRLNVSRVDMTVNLFDALMRRFVESELVGYAG